MCLPLRQFQFKHQFFISAGTAPRGSVPQPEHGWLVPCSKRGDLISVCKYIGEIKTEKGEELFKLRNNAVTRTNGFKVARNKFKHGIR